MTDPRKKWNQRYLEGRRSSLHRTLLQFYPLAPVGRALDVACGTGENAIFLAKKGFDVDGIDISDVAIKIARETAKKEGVTVNFKPCPVEVFSWKPEAYDLIVNFYFLERSLFPKILRSLRRGGVLIFETYNVNHLKLNPDFNREYLLDIGELIRAFKDLNIVYYSEVSNVTTLVGVKP